MTDKTQSDILQTLKQAHQAYADWAAAWLGDASGSQETSQLPNQFQVEQLDVIDRMQKQTKLLQTFVDSIAAQVGMDASDWNTTIEKLFSPADASVSREMEPDSEWQDLRKRWLDAIQSYSPTSWLKNGLEKSPFDISKYSSFLFDSVRSSQHQRLLSDLLNECGVCQKKIVAYQTFCSDVFKDSLLQVGESLGDNPDIICGRELFDTWIDIAENVYSEKTQDDRFEYLVGDLINSIVRVRKQQNLIVEHAAAIYQLVPQSEINEAYAKIKCLQNQIAQLEKQVDDLNRRLQVLEPKRDAKKNIKKKTRKNPMSNSATRKTKMML